MNKKMVLSLSGGETSGMLAYNLFTSGFDVTYIFANTGLENDETLDFINSMEKEWGIKVVWLEAVVNPKHGVGITHRVTSYEKHLGPINTKTQITHITHLLGKAVYQTKLTSSAAID